MKTDFTANLNGAFDHGLIESYFVEHWPRADNNGTEDNPVIVIAVRTDKVIAGESIEEMGRRLLHWQLSGSRVGELEELAGAFE